MSVAGAKKRKCDTLLVSQNKYATPYVCRRNGCAIHLVYRKNPLRHDYNRNRNAVNKPILFSKNRVNAPLYFLRIVPDKSLGGKSLAEIKKSAI